MSDMQQIRKNSNSLSFRSVINDIRRSTKTDGELVIEEDV